jgi:glycosyltransferase involved in cell wall biosynthesis
MTDKATFDGIICLGGEDWWYHNRGHFDFQIMRRLAKDWPVLFVNSIGVRMPDLADKKLFAERIGRKLKSLRRGVVRVETNFWVYSPAALPGEMGQKLTHWGLAPQIRLAARRAGIKRPLLWVHCPAGAGLMAQIPNAGIIMQRTDRFEAFPEGDPVLLSRQIQAIKTAADLVVYAAPHLKDEELGQVKRQVLVTHGVELERFVAAGMGAVPEPSDMGGIRRPRIGFIGGIDAHTFDPELFLGTASLMPDAAFVMIGGSSLPVNWCTLPNVRFLGRKPYDEIAGYMAAMDVLIMPWNGSDWIKACNPVKLKEYLAVGRPVVTRDFAALDGYRDLVRTADSPDSFAREIRAALSEPYNAAEVRRRVGPETWDAKAVIVQDAIGKLGLAFSPGRSPLNAMSQETVA